MARAQLDMIRLQGLNSAFIIEWGMSPQGADGLKADQLFESPLSEGLWVACFLRTVPVFSSALLLLQMQIMTRTMTATWLCTVCSHRLCRHHHTVLPLVHHSMPRLGQVCTVFVLLPELIVREGAHKCELQKQTVRRSEENIETQGDKGRSTLIGMNWLISDV